MKVNPPPQVRPSLALLRNVGHGALWGSSLNRGLREGCRGAGREGRDRSHPSACSSVVVVGSGRGEAAGKDGQEVQAVLKKRRDANVDVQLSVVN